MATVSNSFTGNNSTVDFAFTFPYLKSTDIKVSLDEVVQTLTTHYTLHNATTIRFGSAPGTGVAVKIYRDTASDSLAATFYPGSAIRSSDLNDNFTQNIYVTQEAEVDSDNALSNSRVLESGAYVSAISKATTALSNSTTAVSTANTATSNATTAVNTANTASTNATNAVNTANAASTTATNASNAVGDKIDQDGTIAMEANLAMGSNRITGVTDPSGAQDAATKNYVDTNHYTKTAADSRFYNLASAEEIQSGETWSAADNLVATTAAIDARITDLVDDVGGFVPIANETSFPDANPDVNNGAGTLISIKALAGSLTSNGSGVVTISNGNVSNSATVTINGLENSTTYAATLGMIVETTTTLHTYTFHRVTPKATEVTTVAASITNVNNVGGSIANVNTCASNLTNINAYGSQYQIASSNPSTDGGGASLAAGDLYYNTSTTTLMAYNGSAWVTAGSGAVLNLSGGTMTGDINLGTNDITNGGTITGSFTGNVTGNCSGSSGSCTGNTAGSSGSCTGNAATATALATARAINGTNFDGTAAITITAAAGTVTGSTLNSGVTASSLTSVGTLAKLDLAGLLTEHVTVTAGKLSDNLNLDLANGNVFLFTTAESTTALANLRYNSSTTLNDSMAVGDVVSVTIITTANASAYSAHITIDGSAVTENWVGGSAPDGGGSSGVDIHAFTIIKTAANTYTVIGNHQKTS